METIGAIGCGLAGLGLLLWLVWPSLRSLRHRFRGKCL
jgi:hypothetical protein